MERELVVRRTLTVEYTTPLRSYYDSIEKRQMTEEEAIEHEQSLEAGDVIEIIMMQAEVVDESPLMTSCQVEARDVQPHPNATVGPNPSEEKS